MSLHVLERSSIAPRDVKGKDSRARWRSHTPDRNATEVPIAAPRECILDASFRAGNLYEFIPAADLRSRRGPFFEVLNKNPSIAAILRPRQSSLAAKLLSSDAARFYLALKSSGKVPAVRRHATPAKAAAKVAALVLDGILEIHCGDRFFAGPSAAPVVLSFKSIQLSARRRLTQLAVSALEYGQGLCLRDPIALSSKLYCFNTSPLGAWVPHWESDADDPDSAGAKRRLDTLCNLPGGQYLHERDKGRTVALKADRTNYATQGSPKGGNTQGDRVPIVAKRLG